MENYELTEQEIKERVERWKEEYQAVYLAEINDIWFAFRGLSRGEFKRAVEYYEDDYDRAEYVCRLCVLDPLEVDVGEEQYAGIPETLAKMILQESGFSEGSTKIKELMETYNKEMESFENQITCVIAEVYPQYTPEEIEDWSMEKTMWYFSRAKWTLATLRGVELKQE